MNVNKSNEVVLMSTAKKAPPSVWSNYLLDVAKSESRAAFRHLYEHFGPLIKSYFMAKFPAQNSASMVDELVQEVMIKVWQKAKSFDPNKAAASTWIFTLARNTRIDLLRRQNKYANTTSIETEDIWEDSTEHGPFALLQQNRDSKQVLEGIKKLPEEQALVIHKVYMESKSHTEVSEEMGLPLGTVKSRVRLAQSKLQTLISR
jgi:RNA polymerase sigma-70 factor (ECF subfamily)